MIKHILVFEYITGGGLAQQSLPSSLANEGMLMLNALLQELAELSSIQLTVLQDWRCEHLPLPENAKSVLVSKDQSIDVLIPKLIDGVDAVWLIAPETDFVLSKLSQWVEEKSKVLLNSSSTAVALCSDKLKTIQRLKGHGVRVVETLQLDLFSQDFNAPWVIKTKDGVGCLDSYYVSSRKGLNKINTGFKQSSNYIIQPYVKGDSLSLSCLFKDQKAWLLCCNRQFISLQQGQFELSGCLVNIAVDRQNVFLKIIENVAKAIPGLWGYVGIDFILTDSGDPLVLEINPRLTTSYVGIQASIGINVAKTMIDMIEFQPGIKKSINRQILVPVL